MTHLHQTNIPARRNFLADNRGAIAVMSAFLLPLMIAIVGLVYEFGQGLLVKAQNQRVADAAAYAGALAYNSTSSSTTMAAAALNIAKLNGSSLTSATASCPPSSPTAPNLYVCLTTSPTGDNNNSVSVMISSSDMLVLAPVLNAMPKGGTGVASSLSVSSSSYADLTTQTAGCVMALKASGTGVTLSGGTSVTANNCSVSSNATVSVPCGDTITTKKLTYNSSTAPSEPCTGIVPPSGTASVTITKQATTDPLSANTEVTTATARLSTVEAMTNPTVTSKTGITFAYSAVTGLPSGCTTSQTSSPFTVTCNTGGTYNFGEITLSGGVTVTIKNSGSSTNTYNVSSGSCSGGTYSICDTGTALSFTGPSNFVLPGGIYVGGGSSVTLGSGSSADSYQLGYGSTTSGNYAINVSGGSTLIFGNAEGVSDVFTVNGNITTGGGSCLWLPAAAEHDINGYISPSGGISFADDSTENNVYTVSDYVAFGASGGGNVTCNGTTFGVQAVNTTLVIGGLATISCGGATVTFCVANGYSNITWTAPTTGSTENLGVIGPTSTSITAGAAFTEGSSGSNITGAFYFPNGQLTLNGAGSVTSSGCLELIGSQVNLSGGSSAASACSGLGSSSGSEVTLVQ